MSLKLVIYHISVNYFLGGIFMDVDIILDAGHGGFDNGASYMGRAEKDDVLRLTLAVEQS